jgi:hypothetical protein
MAYVADPGPETALGPLQQAACTYRIALGPRAGQKVLSFQTVSTREPPPTPVRCVDAQGFSLDAEVCCAAHERKQLEHLCRMGTLRMPPASIQKSFVPSVSRSRAFGAGVSAMTTAAPPVSGTRLICDFRPPGV